MRELLVKMLRRIYKCAKSSRYLSALYYDVANIEYFTNLQAQESMLADAARIGAYYNAILKYVKEGDVVLDLGTGTGILSFFAALKKPKKIYAIEHSQKIIEGAQLVADYNGITNIEFINAHSKNVTLKEEVDVILQEQMGPFLFDENMIENVVDLRDRTLKEKGKILPSKFEVFIEPVKLVDKHRVPFIWEQNLYNISFECFKYLRGETGHYGHRFIEAGAVDYSLCKPEAVLFVDLENIKIDEIRRPIQYVRRISRDGRLDGFCFWFNVVFDEEISFNTSPFGSTTNWGHLFLRSESKDYKEGDTIQFSMAIGNVSDRNTYRWAYV